ncbi:MAG: pentapeptide repeat-containing protein [Saprospiraceae bacterium]|nr:pentapeptide repeat-containing protein [Saprospiraceae bacterium]
MKRLINFTGTIVWIGLICCGISYLFKNFQTVAINILAIFGGLAIILISIRLFYGKNWMLNLGKQFFIGSDLIEATENYLEDLPKPSKESTANLMGHLIYRFTRLGLIGLALAAIPIWLLFNQNQLITVQNGFMKSQTDLIKNQTTLLKEQTKRLEQQTYLQEAERRSSLVFLFSNVMDAIDRELKEDVEVKKIRDLSPQLIGRIIALSSRLKPYRFLDGDTLIRKSLSPERGQLLVSLIESKLNNTFDKIYGKLNLTSADLTGANLGGADLTDANLRNADLADANLRNTDLTDANLIGANLRNADLTDANLIGANLRNVDLRNVKLIGANLIGTNLEDANLIGANLRNANLRNAKFSKKSFSFLTMNKSIDIFNNYTLDSLHFHPDKNYFLRSK